VDSSFNRLAGRAREHEQSPSLDREYWLRHCEGYRVDSAGGRVGLVEEVRHAVGSGHPESLAVLAGMLGRRRLIIPLSEVAEIVPHAQRVFLKPGVTIAASEACGV
jgi:hypothetical protein